MTEQASLTTQQRRQKAGKYLTFVLADEVYGLEILKVREILGVMDITAVPRTPSFVKGVVNLRGKVIPVVDLRLKFGMNETGRTEETCIIVVDVDRLELGLIVDRVSEVQDISEADIDDTPEFGVNVNTEFILGMGKAAGKVTILLDIDKVLATSETVEITNLAKAASGELENENG